MTADGITWDVMGVNELAVARALTRAPAQRGASLINGA